MKDEHKDKVTSSYAQICKALQQEADLIAKTGPGMIPDIEFDDVKEGKAYFQKLCKAE